MTIKAFPSMERTLLALLERDYAPLAGAPERIGGDLPGTLPADWYVRLDRVSSRTTRFEGDFVVDVEVFGTDYAQAESIAFDIEAFLLGYPHRVEVDGQSVILDRVEQNAGVADIFWDDDTVHRFSSTYVITARRR